MASSSSSSGAGSSSSSSGGSGGLFSSSSSGIGSSSSYSSVDVEPSLKQLAVTDEGEEEINEATGETVLLLTSDLKEFEVSIAAASMSGTIKRILEDYDGSPIPLARVDSTVLPKIIEYCNKHVAWEETRPTPLKKWDAEYAESLAADVEMLRRVMLGAFFLEVQGLLNLLVKATANLIKRKSPEEIRRTFKIEKDFTPEQEEEVREKYGWAVFED